MALVMLYSADALNTLGFFSGFLPTINDKLDHSSPNQIMRNICNPFKILWWLFSASGTGVLCSRCTSTIVDMSP